jgi:hypothetical protein
MEETMKALAVLFTLTLATILSVPQMAGEISSLLPGTGASLSLPGPEAVDTAFVRDLPQALMTAGMGGAIQQQPPKAPDIDLTINVEKEKKEPTRAWYLNPVWMAIGGLGLALLIVLILLAARGGGSATTVVRG